MSRRNTCPATASSSRQSAAPRIRSSFRAGRFHVLDHEDAIEMLIRSDVFADDPYTYIRKPGKHSDRCLVAILLDVELVGRAVLIIDDVPNPLTHETIASLQGVLTELPGHISAVVVALCEANDPPVDHLDEVQLLSELIDPLDAVGIELRDIIHCFPSGFSSLRAA